MLDTKRLNAWDKEDDMPRQGKKVCMVSRHTDKEDEREKEEKKNTTVQLFL